MKKGRRTIDSLLSHNSYRIEVSTGITIPDDMEFIQPRTFVGGHPNDRARLEQELYDWETKIRNKYSAMVATHGYGFPNDIFRSSIRLTTSEARGSEVVDTRTTLSAFIEQFRDRMNSGLMTKRSNGKPYSNMTIRLLGMIIDVIEEFIITQGDFDFGKYNLDTESTVGKLTVVRAYDDLCERYKSFLIKEKKYGNYVIHDYTVRMGFIIRDRCESHGINLSNRYLAKLKYSSPRERIVVALSQEQFEWILNNEQRIREDHRMLTWANEVIDYMIAGLLTAARIGDLNRLTINNLIKTEDGYILSYVPHKTKNSSGVKVEIPIPERLVKMFLANAEKHNGKLLYTKHESTIDSASPYLKEILKKYDVFHNQVQVQDKHGEIEIKPFWRAFRFHSTRASLITYLLNQGEQETVIKSISGHTLDSSSFKVYTDISTAMKMRTMQKVAMIGVA